jgi:hypothetical protein
MVVRDRHGLGVAVCVENATPHEVKLATYAIVRMVVPEAPQNLINAYMLMTAANWTQNSGNMESN